jgi:predicted nucleic acid-binding protein
MIVVSDTSPICYLILLEQIELLPRLYDRVVIPQQVWNELANERSPNAVQEWIAQPPEWLEIQPVTVDVDAELQNLDPGEQAAILLVEQLEANMLVVDEMLGRQIARSRGLRVIGVLGILEEAGRLGWINLPVVLEQLQQTTFRVSGELIQQMLARYRSQG